MDNVLVERSENPETVFHDLRIYNVPERKFIRRIYSGAIKDDLDSLVVRFESLRHMSGGFLKRDLPAQISQAGFL